MNFTGNLFCIKKTHTTLQSILLPHVDSETFDCAVVVFVPA